MSAEVIYTDGSTSTFGGGGSMHAGHVAVNRFSLICAEQALTVYIRSDGKFQVTANGAQKAIANVIAPITGKSYKRSMNGKREALADCIAIIEEIENAAVVYVGEEG